LHMSASRAGGMGTVPGDHCAIVNNPPQATVMLNRRSLLASNFIGIDLK
jgi:hypothetical protein